MSPGGPSWGEFAAKLASVAEIDAAGIQQEARLIEDLDLDSLAVIELVVALMNDYGLAMPDGIDAERWDGLTAGQLFESVTQGTIP